MNTNQIKKFATDARTRLLKGVVNKLKAYFDEKGRPHLEPTWVQGGCVYGEQLLDEAFYRAWQSLYKHIQLYGFRTTAEDVAYTWFNRLVAINILAKNGIVEPVLHFSNPMVRVPQIVEQARAGQFPEMSVDAKDKLNQLLSDPTKTFDQFSFLMDRYCVANPIIRKCFGSVDDFSYLLLPNNILAEGELVDMLNNSDYISDEDYRAPELIGWLYQFYISEKKDEVSKKGKFESDEIPAATQIFTPNWIVKYMVQNSLGRIYLDTEVYSEIKSGMKYLVAAEEGGEKFAWTDVKELTCADLACGSGHILNECFDLLYDIYIEQGYSRREAVESIFAHNLLGIDIDTRAKQMAQFALLLKACKRDAAFADAHAMPRVFDMPEPYADKDRLPELLAHFFLGSNPQMTSEVMEAIALFDEAKNLGSIMKFHISPSTREAIVRRLAEHRAAGTTDLEPLFPYFEIILALTDKYAALVMNPPYMGGGNMNPVLSKYVKDNYEEGKADLCTVFMLVQSERTIKNGCYGNIVPPSWMFLSTFESLRKSIIKNRSIQSLLHLSRGIFGADFGSVSCVIKNTKSKDAHGAYFRLIERTFQEFDQKHLKLLFEKTLADHNFRYYFADYTKDVEDIVYSENGAKIYYPNISQNNFEKIPGSPIGYWVSETFIEIVQGETLADLAHPRRTIQCGNVEKYIRLWHEVGFDDIEQSCNINLLVNSSQSWFKFSSGGNLRRWYGNNDSVLYWKNNGGIIKETGKAIIPNEDLYFKKCVGYNRITSNGISARMFQAGLLLGDATSIIVPEQLHEYYLSLLNSKVTNYSMAVFNPTLAAQTGSLSKVPIVFKNIEFVQRITEQNISLSQLDWDAHETSWDFKENELVRIFKDKGCGKLDVLVNEYKTHWEQQFFQLHANEEELNRQFIEIYELQDELTPDVPLNEITILQQGEISVDGAQLEWHNDVIAKQLISYAIGTWMGRYRLDKSGLHIAHPEPTDEEVVTYTYNGEDFEIDDDGIIPILTEDSGFADNACHRLRDFLRIAFGEDNLIDNINFIQDALGKTIETYFIKDFWKDHKKMYQNRPIYWLFSSKKGAFQCLVYMHRMNAYTAERVRSKYLLPHMESLGIRIAELRANEAQLTLQQRKTLDRLVKELDECREYHDRLHLVADQQIAFDLDDGVVVNHAKFGDVLAKLK